MEYGCIGEHLGHSFSKEIHAQFADYNYDIYEIPREDLDLFLTERDFRAINVTIPYKESVIPYLYEIDDAAREIGAVNTIVNRNGRLYGYNTDFFGMRDLILHEGINLSGKKVVILGTGGTAKTARQVAKSLSAAEIYTVSRTAGEGVITYDTLYALHTDAEIIINTTPVGMYPNPYAAPVELSKFPKLSGVVDAVYNPLRTELILEAQRLGIKASGGLYMLVAQAARACEIFLDKEIEAQEVEKVYHKILRSKENIVLVGMPASGKTTVGKILSKVLNTELIDTDDLIEQENKMIIRDIFDRFGEPEFRKMETEVIKGNTAKLNGRVISTGGGAVLKSENVNALKMNGRIYLIDRPLEQLIPTDSRPTASSRQDLEKRYRERYDVYHSCADVIIPVTSDAQSVADAILEDFNK